MIQLRVAFISLCIISCKASPRIEEIAKIINGEVTNPEEFPWQVAISSVDVHLGYIHLCGGALIDPMWVLTAAHCVEKRPASLLSVGVGEYDMTNDNDQENCEVEKIILYDLWEASEYVHDIALLKLAKPVILSKRVEVVNLAKPGYRIKEGDFGWVTGWGITENGYADKLRKVELEILQDSVCKAVYKKYSTTTTYCGGTLDGSKDSCIGDSGGPMSVYKDGAWYIVGIVSYGRGCGTAGYPGVYTEVSFYYDWITNKIYK